MTLSQGQLDVLYNLSRKKAGDPVGWVAIGPARTLTMLGLAVRNSSGWQITADGEAALNLQSDAVRSDPIAQSLPFPLNGRPANQ